MKRKQPHHLLIDGDYLLYKIGFGSQKTLYRVYEAGNEVDGYLQEFDKKRKLTDWIEKRGEPEYDWSWDKRVKADPIGIARYNIKANMTRLKGLSGNISKVTIFFTDTLNFRDKVATLLPYKGNRDTSHKPYYFKMIKEYLLANYDCQVVYGCEADDALGIHQMRADEGTTIIYTPDKDLDMIPGWRLDKKSEVIWITEEEARASFYLQLLMGDNTDNIPGLFKVTGKKAMKPLKEGLKLAGESEEEYSFLREIYEERGIPAGRDVDGILLEIATLLYMKRDYGDRVDPRDFWKGIQFK